MKDIKTDILIVGGGAAGIAAALSAKKSDCKVTLVEKQGYLGGAITAGFVTYIAGARKNRNEKIDNNIISQIVNKMDKYEGGIYDRLRNPVVHPEIFKIVVEQMLRKAGVDIYYFCDSDFAFLADKEITSISFNFRSTVFNIIPKIVIDCTGDGNIFYRCGEPFNQYYPADISITTTMRMVNVETKRAEKFLETSQGMILLHDFGVTGFSRTAIDSVVTLDIDFIGVPAYDEWRNLLCEDPFKQDRPEDLSAINIINRKKVLELAETLREEFDGFENSFLLDTAPSLGIRMTRTLKGKYILTEKDFRDQKKFDDLVVSCISEIKDESGNDLPLNIPYRSLLPKNTKNLIVAGRCISTDFYIMRESARLIGPCFETGQAAGIAAWRALEGEINPEAVNAKKIREEMNK